VEELKKASGQKKGEIPTNDTNLQTRAQKEVHKKLIKNDNSYRWRDS